MKQFRYSFLRKIRGTIRSVSEVWGDIFTAACTTKKPFTVSPQLRVVKGLVRFGLVWFGLVWCGRKE